MKEYSTIDRCLITLRSSRMDVITKLRMEQLLSGISMLLLVEQDHAADLEELFKHVNDVCMGESADGVRGLVDHARKMQIAMARA